MAGTSPAMTTEGLAPFLCSVTARSVVLGSQTVGWKNHIFSIPGMEPPPRIA
jgi:hypothetical protein